MKVRERDGRLVVSQRNLWPAAFGVALLVAALAFAAFLQARLELNCESDAGDRRCLLVEHSLLMVRSHAAITAADVERIEIVDLRPEDDDEDTLCVVIVTASASHEVDRCSGLREPRLEALVGELNAFYAGERAAVSRRLSDEGFVWFLVALFGLMGLPALFGPTMWRAELDRRRGVVSVRGGLWLFRSSRRVALDDVVGVSVVSFDGENGERHSLVLDLVDGGRVPLSDDTDADLEPVRQTVAAFLADGRPGYR
jgi:hypothetical protein